MESPDSRFKKRIRLSGAGCAMRGYLGRQRLNTVCTSARCPNREECFGRGVATFMILGDSCTRDCRFCAVSHGIPETVDVDEPARIAQAVRDKGLRHTVVTSVTRDDLTDGGATQFAAVIAAVRAAVPGAAVEVLTPDFGGDTASLQTVLNARPDVFNHNVETVPFRYAAVRPGAVYKRSLTVLRHAAESGAAKAVKSGLMVGLGETPDELETVFADLAGAGCGILTIGQYFRPDPSRVQVVRFYEDDEFRELEERARAAGLAQVVAGRFVRSSYRAREVFAAYRGA